MPNKLFIAGGPSPFPSGRPKGSKRSGKRNLERLAALILTVKELKNNYDHMKPGTERWKMQNSLIELLYPKATGVSIEEIESAFRNVEEKIIDAQRKAV